MWAATKVKRTGMFWETEGQGEMAYMEEGWEMDRQTGGRYTKEEEKEEEGGLSEMLRRVSQ